MSPARTAAPSGGPDEQIINPNAYTLNGFRLGTIGTAERGDCTGPGYFQTDLAFYKNFPLKSGVKLQFRWDIFNVFNNTNFLFQNLDATMDPSAVVAERGADRDRRARRSRPASARRRGRAIPRQMQIGFKLLW